MVNEEKQKALDAAIVQIEKSFGKGAVMKLGDSGASAWMWRWDWAAFPGEG